MASSFGDIVRRLRREKDMSQERLAELAKVDAKTIVQIENGKRNPTLRSLQKIANSLKVPLKDLIP